MEIKLRGKRANRGSKCLWLHAMPVMQFLFSFLLPRPTTQETPPASPWARSCLHFIGKKIDGGASLLSPLGQRPQSFFFVAFFSQSPVTK